VTDSLESAIQAAYGFDGDGVKLGAAMHDGSTLPAAVIRFPLAMLNRHGLVAGATGTGKTKTLQVMAEQLTQLGIGEAMVTGLDPRGIPMPTVRTMMRPPMSLMAELDPAALAAVVAASPLTPRYATDVDAVTAKEMLQAQATTADADAATTPPTPVPPTGAGSGGPKRPTHAPEKGEGVDWGQVAKEGARVARSGAFNTILRGIIRGLGGRR
jgi:hypothetical protein